MQNTTPEDNKKFWGPQYGSIYPYLEDATPYRKLLKQIEDFINPKAGERWLDIGTGSGAMVDLIWKKSKGTVAKITALDLTETMLEHLRRRLPALDPPMGEDKIELIQHDLSNKLPFADGSFDGVIASLVLTYITHHEGREGEDALKAVLEEVYRVLKPGGEFVWTTPKHKVNFARVFAGSWREILNPKKYYNLFYGPAILRYALEIQKKGKKGEYNFLPEERFFEMMRSVGFGNIRRELSFAGQALVFSCKKAT